MTLFLNIQKKLWRRIVSFNSINFCQNVCVSHNYKNKSRSIFSFFNQLKHKHNLHKPLASNDLLHPKQIFIFSTKFLIALTIVSWTHDYLIDLCPAIGPSMYPLIEGSGDLLVFERLTAWMTKIFTEEYFPKSRWKWLLAKMEYKRGDIVIAMSIDKVPVKICKRVVAVENDMILVHTDSDPINEQRKEIKLIKIPKGTLWLQGDNVNDSYDSRHYGPVPIHNILGRVICRIWPLRSCCWMINQTIPPAITKQYINNIPSDLLKHSIEFPSQDYITIK